jgi:hypothetical protein
VPLMDVPILTAVIGVSGTLLGTIVGGCLTTFTNILVQKRRERAEFRIGCRLVAGELQENLGVMRTCLANKGWWPSEMAPVAQAWEKHQHILAAYLPYEVWSDVFLAMRAVQFVNHLWVIGVAKHEGYTLAGAKHEADMEDTDTTLVAGCLKAIEKGQASLQPYFSKTKAH